MYFCIQQLVFMQIKKTYWHVSKSFKAMLLKKTFIDMFHNQLKAMPTEKTYLHVSKSLKYTPIKKTLFTCFKIIESHANKENIIDMLQNNSKPRQ